jgi:hypothetical protein
MTGLEGHAPPAFGSFRRGKISRVGWWHISASWKVRKGVSTSETTHFRKRACGAPGISRFSSETFHFPPINPIIKIAGFARLVGISQEGERRALIDSKVRDALSALERASDGE